MSDSVLYDIQQIVQDYLYTTEYFRDIPIITEDNLELNSDLDKAEAGHLPGPTGKFGAAIRVITVAGGGSIPNITAAASLKGDIFFDVYEMPQFNRKTRADGSLDGGIGKKGIFLAERIWLVMKVFASSEEPNLNFWDAQTVISQPTVVDNGLVFRRVHMHWSHAGNVETTPLVETPVIVCTEEGVFSLTCATVGAGIWYTTDETRPTFQNGTLYNGGDVVAGTVTVKARAYYPGMRASLIATADIFSAMGMEGSGTMMGTEGEPPRVMGVE